MAPQLYQTPFAAALVFLSHSWQDNTATDYIYSKLTKEFRVFCDRSGVEDVDPALTLEAGGELLPSESIARSDVFVFLASPSSTAIDSRAYDERSIARNLLKAAAPTVVEVFLENYQGSDVEAARLYLRFRWRSRSRDASEIVSRIKAVLQKRGGLYRAPHSQRDSALTLLGGKEVDVVLQAIRSPTGRGRYALNAVFPYAEMRRIADAVDSLDKTNKEEFLDHLVRFFVDEWGSDDLAVARQNVITLASKVARGQKNLVKEFVRRRPDFPSAFLYRGFHLALGTLGDEEAARNYARSLYDEAGQEWNEQRWVNRRFHLHYYGGLAPTLEKLRRTIQVLSPAHLLTLNVYTLGEMSPYLRDAQLIHECESELRGIGVPQEILRSAARRIRSRAGRRFQRRKRK